MRIWQTSCFGPLFAAIFFQMQSVLAVDSAKTWQDLSISAAKAQRAAKLDEAERLLSKALTVAEEFGDSDPRLTQSLAALTNLCIVRGELDKAETLCRRELSILSRLGTKYSDTRKVLLRLGRIKYDQFNYPEAEKFLSQALVIERESPGVLSDRELVILQYFLASACYRQKEYVKAESLLEEAIRVKRRIVRHEKWELRTLIVAKAQILLAMGKVSQADECLKEVLLKGQYTDEREAARWYTTVATLYFEANDYARAEPLFKEALAIRERYVEKSTASLADRVVLIDCLIRLGNMYRIEGRGEKAQEYCERALASAERTYPKDDPKTGDVSLCLGLAYQLRKKYGSAEQMFKRAIAIKEKNKLAKDRYAWRPYAQLAHMYLSQKRYAEAEPLFERSIALKTSTVPTYDANLAVLWYSWADDLFYQKKFAAAEPVYRKALSIEQALVDQQVEQLTHVLVALAVTLSSLNKDDQADPLFKRAVGILAKEPDLKVEYIGTLYQYAAYLQKFKRYNEANELLAQIRRLEADSKKQTGSK